MDEQDFPGVSSEFSFVQKGQGERQGRQSPPGITCPTGLSRVDVVSLPRCQGHTQTPASPSTQQGSACSVLSSPRVPDSLQGHSPRHLQCLSSRTSPGDALGTEEPGGLPESRQAPSWRTHEPHWREGCSASRVSFRPTSQAASPTWGSPGAAGTQAAGGALVTRAQLLPRSALVSRGLQTDRKRTAGTRALQGFQCA